LGSAIKLFYLDRDRSESVKKRKIPLGSMEFYSSFFQKNAAINDN